jgi:hypothetical protein
MLVRYNDVLVPRGTPESLVDFLLDNQHSRFTYAMHIPEAEHSKIWCDDVYFKKDNYRKEIEIHTYANSYRRSIPLYALDHFIYVIPVNRRCRKANDPGWMRPDAVKLITQEKERVNPSNAGYRLQVLLEWLENNPNVN